MKYVSAWFARLYESLTWCDAIQAADLIFVMAGRMDRKVYGLDLFRRGIAPQLILSIGRFEVSKMAAVTPAAADKLIALRDATPPRERHFFMTLQSSDIRVEKVRLAKWNTYGEVLALRELIARRQLRRVVVTSTHHHLRRVRLTCRRLFRGMAVDLLYCAVPSRPLDHVESPWWTSPAERSAILREWLKLIGYRMILAMPSRVAYWVMRMRP